MVLRKIALVAVAIGAILSFTCLMSLLPNPDAVLFSDEEVKVENIGKAALCVAPLGISFILAIIAALGGE